MTSSDTKLETDYLIVGCGAAGMAFADSLIATSKSVDVIMIDRRHSPGGHWIEAYPFVRLHQPAAFYGVTSTPLGPETIDQHGENKGMYYRAGAAEICGYYDFVMQHRLLASGRVRYFPMSNYNGADDNRNHRFTSLLSGDITGVKVRKKIVDGTYLEGRFPASTPPPFEVVDGVRCIPVGQLALVTDKPDGYVVIGGGKTALDACSWLLDQGVLPSAIRWIKPREAWFLNRAFLQGGELVGTFVEGLAVQLEAIAQASSVDDLFARLEAVKQVLRVDTQVTPTMFRGPTISTHEVDQLRRIEDVIRGKVKRIERERIILDNGASEPTSARHLHIHCAAQGLNLAPAIPIFTSADRITLQSIRLGLLPFAAAITAFIEVTRSDDDNLVQKNRLCPPSAQPNTPLDWLRGTLVGMKADYLWSKEPDIAEWLNKSRLNIARGIRDRVGDPQLGQAFGRYAANARPALANLERLIASG